MYDKVELEVGDKTLRDYQVPRDAVLMLHILSEDGSGDEMGGRKGQREADAGFSGTLLCGFTMVEHVDAAPLDLVAETTAKDKGVASGSEIAARSRHVAEPQVLPAADGHADQAPSRDRAKRSTGNGSKAPEPEVRTVLSAGPATEKRVRVQPDRSFPPAEGSARAPTKTKRRANGKSSAASAPHRKRSRRNSHDSGSGSDEDFEGLKQAVEASRREQAPTFRPSRRTRRSDDHEDQEKEDLQRAVEASLISLSDAPRDVVVVSDQVDLVGRMP